MKLISRYFLTSTICGAFALLSPMLHAQTPAGGKLQERGVLLKRICEVLDLSEQQRSVLKPIVEEIHAKITAAREDSTLSEEQKKARVKEILQASRSQIKDILTPEQQQKALEIIEKIRERRELQPQK